MRNVIFILLISFVICIFASIDMVYAQTGKVYGCPYHEYVTFKPQLSKNKCIFGDGRDLELVTEGRLIMKEDNGKERVLLDTVKVKEADKLRSYIVVYNDPNGSEKSFKSHPGWIRQIKEIRFACSEDLFSTMPLGCPAGTEPREILGPDDDAAPKTEPPSREGER